MNAGISLIPSNACIEFMAMLEVQDLSKCEPTGFHESSSAISGSTPEAKLTIRRDVVLAQ